MIALGVDVGGTFTDLVLRDAAGRLHAHKLLTTPDDPARAIAEGVAQLLARAMVAPGAVGAAVHATTLFTNAVIARQGARTGFVTTAGFRDVLETGREVRHDVYDLFVERPRPLVPRPLRLELDERVAADGRVLVALDEGAIPGLAAALASAGIESLVIGFLHSHAFPAHERRAGALFAELLPGVPVTLSSTIAPEQGEYERFTTASVNGYVRPLASRYLHGVAARLGALGIAATPCVMRSDGVLADAATAAGEPVRLLESGPAAGAIAAASLARRHGIAEALAFDMGGTTAKVCLVRNGAATLGPGFEAARLARLRRHSGLPVRVPSVALIEIGAGGGSIARPDAMGLVQVGPESAGADPGPACYGRGGRHATVTDAAVLLGLIDPRNFLGGEMPLDRAAASAAIAEALAAPLGITVEAAAERILMVAGEAMAAAARMHAAEHGSDLSRATLVAFGGAGPLFAEVLAARLGMRRILMPAGAGVLSAHGLLAEAQCPDVAVHATPAPPASTRRAAWFAGHGMLDASVHQRATLPPGQDLHGPALIEDPETTFVLAPGSTARLTPDGALAVLRGRDRLASAAE